MTVEMRMEGAGDWQRSQAQEFGRRYVNLLCELQLQTGIHQRIDRIVTAFVEQRPSLRATYISRHVDPSYFEDGSCGWEASSRPQLQGLAVDDRNIFEFFAFSHGFRSHVTPISAIVHIEETWLEPSPGQPFLFRACLHHSFPATTILTAPDGDMQDEAYQFLRSLKYARGF